ncbi:peroxisome proliferator-activated receptor gamma coactivator-related protein 1 [Solea senegalensis]|uniref:Peroxisome proliferator-activated receptor gamma coactivator-related protein 1 n=1 Tax=Solea senegalensis TaxID=28829 RepID=A0AAV6S4D9_SOLSE|nr:peroxisome proliferator-activated receptor gamma coactivator-related protein 1 [Solea senegalensis]KAG7512590.1 peroxisome proliferator-activated receptor gamma coactivator-related protein 1 [Solea senegalensis]
MAARWGTGEETLTACNMEFFPLDTLNETSGLSSEETLEVLQNCLDPSILSIFEDTPTIETKGLDEESEATLLTALTEILDNVDDENLSPFDTLPDSDLLSGQKGREHSPLRRLLCLSRSPPEKDSLSRPISTGKSLPRIQRDSLQRSDGEEEDDGSFTLSPVEHDLSCDNELFDWKGQTLPLPVTFEQEGEDGVSISLGDLVRHMHPYCMAICLENDEGEQMLPEGGILLEVVDQGENGEPILAIPNMDLPVSLPLREQLSEIEQKNIDEAEEVASDTSEHIIVVDENTMEVEPPVKVTSPAMPGGSEDVKDEKVVKRQKKDVKEKSCSMRKKKKECKDQCQSKPVEGRVLRSGTVRQTASKVPTKPGKTSVKQEKKLKVPHASSPTPSSVKPKKINPCQSDAQVKTTTTTPLPEMNVQVATCMSPSQDTALLKNNPETSQRSCTPTALSSQQPEEILKQAISAPAKLAVSSAAPSAALAPLFTETFAAAQSPVPPQLTPPVCEALPPVATVVPEPKPKSLSLAEYRRLRQQKKPAPVEKMETNSTKWPSLPELPKELPPIPCLPDPSPKDPRRPNPQAAKKEEEEVKTAWHPRGPAAPPTPEALLVPPAYMVASSSKVSAATPVAKPPQMSESSKPESVAAVPNSMKESSMHHHAQPAVPSVHQSSSPASLNEASKSVSSAGDKCCPTLSGENSGSQSHPVSHKSVQLNEGCTKTTTVLVKPNAATPPAPNIPQKTNVLQNVADITAATTINCPITADCESSKPVDIGARIGPPIAAQSSDSLRFEEKPVRLEAKQKPTTVVNPQKAKNPTEELIEAFTSEMGIEAADLTSLLEQFEETQAKEEHCVPEVSGRAVAVGNSSLQLAPEKTIVERVRANDLASSAALTPPATPPHQMWKPLVPVTLLGKSKAAEASKSSPSKVIQIEARPLPSFKSRSKPTPVCAPVDPSLACMDHDYCLPNKGTSPGEPGRRWNVKQQTFITIKPIKQSTTTTTQTCVQSTTSATVATKTQGFPATDALDHSYVLETPDASPAQQETESTDKVESPRRRTYERVYRRHAASRTPSPASSPKERTGGRSRKRRRSHHSPSPMSSSSESDSHSSRSRSRSPAPSKKRYRPRHSESSSSSSSRSSSRSSTPMSRSPPRRRRYSYSSSHSGSWSGSRSHSRSPDRSAQWRSRAWRSPSYRPGYGQNAHTCVEQIQRRKEKAIEERRIVYVGRIRGTMTQKELKERFSLYGEIEDCTLHFRDHGDNYGFITYYDTKDAFRAIENGSKLRKPDELPFDLCFGGRRQFCQSNYADLDSNRGYDPSPVKGKFHALDFDTLLKQAKQNQKR